MKQLDTYDRGTVEWRAVSVLDNGLQVTEPIEFAVTTGSPDGAWTAAVTREGQPGVMIDTTTMQPGTYTIRARWTDGADRPQIVAGRIVVA